jgi:hypothetical protein
MMASATVLVFGHTAAGEKALRELLAVGVRHEDVRVIGDLGPATSQPGAEHHVTFDALHVPGAERELLMDTVRAGGVVLAVVGLDRATEIERIGEKAGALKVFGTVEGGANPSHNVAG